MIVLCCISFPWSSCLRFSLSGVEVAMVRKCLTASMSVIDWECLIFRWTIRIRWFWRLMSYFRKHVWSCWMLSCNSCQCHAAKSVIKGRGHKKTCFKAQGMNKADGEVGSGRVKVTRSVGGNHMAGFWLRRVRKFVSCRCCRRFFCPSASSR